MIENYSYVYPRVSTVQQDLSRQLDLLNQYNCIEIVTDKMSGISQATLYRYIHK